MVIKRERFDVFLLIEINGTNRTYLYGVFEIIAYCEILVSIIKNALYGTCINTHKLRSNSNAKDVLTPYAEELACDNFDNKKYYNVHRNTSLSWFVLNKEVGSITSIDNSESTIRFDWVRIVRRAWIHSVFMRVLSALSINMSSRVCCTERYQILRAFLISYQVV